MQYKIALQLSGQLRNWNTSVKYWNNLISILKNVDVYTCFGMKIMQGNKI